MTYVDRIPTKIITFQCTHETLAHIPSLTARPGYWAHWGSPPSFLLRRTCHFSGWKSTGTITSAILMAVPQLETTFSAHSKFRHMGKRRPCPKGTTWETIRLFRFLMPPTSPGHCQMNEIANLPCNNEITYMNFEEIVWVEGWIYWLQSECKILLNAEVLISRKCWAL